MSRATVLTDTLEGGNYAEFCTHKISFMEGNVCNSRNEKDIL